jgi:hypothetical protein
MSLKVESNTWNLENGTYFRNENFLFWGKKMSEIKINDISVYLKNLYIVPRSRQMLISGACETTCSGRE